MKRGVWLLALTAMALAFTVKPALAQRGSVQGVCRDTEGKPIAGAIVEYDNTDTGRKFQIKTNNKGEYFSLGLDYGPYQVTLTKDGQVLDKVNKFQVVSGENTLDFDIKKSQQQAAQQKGISPEQLKQMQEQQERAAKETNVVKALNEKLGVANQAIKAEDYDTAINVLSEANQLDPTRDLLWARLADAFLGSAPKQTDSAEKSRRYGEAFADYQKAIDLKQKSMATEKKPEDVAKLAGYYNNMAQAASRTGKTDEALKGYEQAAQLNPAGAGQYYFNEGAILTNSGRADDANAAFDKAIAADPTKADAYYQKGVNLLSKATTDPKTGKVVPAPGTEEALNKYLELQPNGPYADGAKSMLQYIGGTIETSFGGKKKTTPTPKK